MTLRDPNCLWCHQVTSGNCGRHEVVSAAAPPQPEPVHLTLRWCQCRGTQVCLGCLIDALVHREYGLQGWNYLRDRTGRRTDA